MMILGIIQARIDSTRFPLKIFSEFSDGTSLLERVVRQVSHSKLIDNIVIATNYFSYSMIREIVDRLKLNVDVKVGDDEDVLGRFIKCISSYNSNFDNIVRITADNPLTCPIAIDEAIKLHISKNADLTHFLGIPLGTGVEVIKTSRLFEINELSFEMYDREHVTPYFYKHKEIYKVLEPVYREGWDYQSIRVTIDYPIDLESVDRILHKLDYKLPVYIDDVVSVVEALTNV
jgi:spore coat polysaccharide biosynthesis protein SpsF